jgi:gamma-glutamyltranspeptidase/glutathione hydrolase
VWHVVEHEMSMYDAVAEPRLHDQLMPNQVTFEYSFDNSTVASMADKGHNVTWVRPGVSAVQGIRMLWDGSFEAVGETRQKNSGGLSV